MLKGLSEKWGLKEIDTVRANDFMDDGSELKLALTINRNDGTAIFDFDVILYCLTEIGNGSRDVWEL